jgi:hypothetical protein
MSAQTTLFNLGFLFCAVGGATGKPILAIAAKMFLSLEVVLGICQKKYHIYSPLFELLKQDEQIALLIRQILTKEGFTRKFGLQIVDLDNQALAFFAVLDFQL